ncbi:hypothetical protein DMA15_04000 [Streptomyces sp. WAC 01529]|uniref:hypothetical protein n=1 Tax=Streptomyces sp. WAC 01529 TaxID=2203205 RepID=UPI000F705350|nr:hypothetical protein [Streptomyces sp. WAC 01529]AZM51852.1 hypothetical protein DMA15_04000 [Streptomyces sp. WAC 01529]
MAGFSEDDYLMDPHQSFVNLSPGDGTEDGPSVGTLRFLGSVDMEPPTRRTSLTCPNGHASTMHDWCDICGHRMPGNPPYSSGAAAMARAAEYEATATPDATATETTGPGGAEVLAPPPESRSRRSRCVNLAARLLPCQDRERWLEEWQAEWFDLGARPARVRVAFVARLVLHSGPRLAWLLRVGRPKETA